MSRKSPRRTLLKGLAVTLPAAWARLVVESVILPAHGQTSNVPITATGCSAPAGCYVIAATDRVSFSWPGGQGPVYNIMISDDEICTPPDSTINARDMVVAANQADAESAFGGDPAGIVITDPVLPGGCRFYSRLE